MRDFVIGVAGLRPWRCKNCDKRFFAWSVPIPYVRFAHCSRCGNLGVKHIANEYGEGNLRLLWRLMRVPAYRCAPCRNRFFSILPLMQAEEAEPEAAVEKPAVTHK